MNALWQISMPPPKHPGVRYVWDLEIYFMQGGFICRQRIDAPGRVWIHRNCIWELLT